MNKLSSSINENVQNFNGFCIIKSHFQHPILTFLFLVNFHSSEFGELSFRSFFSLLLKSWMMRANFLVKCPPLKNRKIVVYVSELSLVSAEQWLLKSQAVLAALVR